MKTVTWNIAAVTTWFLVHMGSALAGPGVIVAPRVEAFAEPSDSAEVLAELGRGAQVLVFDDESATEVVYRRPGWVAIRLPGSGGVGYVRAEAVDHEPPHGSRAPSDAVAVADPLETGPTRARDWSPPPDPPHEPSAVERAPASDGRAGRFLPLKPVRIQVGVGSGVAWLRRASAAENRIGDSGPTLNFSCALLIADVVSLSGDVGGIFTQDDGAFSQSVEPVNGGNSFTADSSLNLTRYSVAVGLRTPFLALSETEHGWFAAALHAHFGRAGVAGGRGIDNCVDCDSDELRFPSGSFWRVGVDLTAPRSRSFRYGLTAAYQGYLGDAGVTDEIQIGASIWWL